MIRRNSNSFKSIAATLCVALLVQMAAPVVSWALTSGPIQPEFTDFEPVATTNMVNEFSGAFTYNLPVINVPGANGGGYALSLSYHGGAQPEQDASWVGYGWSLNPGAILRGAKGFPDDFYGESYGGQPADQMTYINKTKPNWTFTAGIMANYELFSGDQASGGTNSTSSNSGSGSTTTNNNGQNPTPGTNTNTNTDQNVDDESSAVSNLLNGAKSVNLGARYSVRLNSYKGFGYVAGLSASIYGVANLGYAVSDNSSTFSASLNPAGLLSTIFMNAVRMDRLPSEMKAYDVPTEDQARDIQNRKWANFYLGRASGAAASAIGSMTQYSLAPDYYKNLPMNVTPYASANSYNLTGGMQFLQGTFSGLQGQLTANYTRQDPDESRSVNSWGYMYTAKGFNKNNDALDYFLEREASYDVRDKFLPIPFSNADQFSLTGEGLGGAFRLHQSTVGIFRPPSRTSSTNLWDVGAEFGLGDAVSAGLNFGYGTQELESTKWNDAHSTSRNSKYSFAEESASSYCSRVDEPTFFRFNGDMGGEIKYAYDDEPIKLRHPAGIADAPVLPRTLHPVMNMGLRDGRSSMISHSSNEDVKNGLGYTSDPDLINYYMRDVSPRGIGEFAVTDPGGTRYVYGLPVYSAREYNVSFLNGFADDEATIQHDGNYSIAKMDNVSFGGAPKISQIVNDDKVKVVGTYKDRPNASSFLLTEIRSPDFIDVDDNGPDHGDIGAWVKFSYQAEHGGPLDGTYTPESNWYRYRMPYSGLSYEAGSLSDPEDNSGAVQTGHKQIFYLNGIETKTHKAVFTLGQRRDGLSAHPDEWPHINNFNGTGDDAAKDKLMRLERIDLYAKSADGTIPANARPVKTVHFKYDYHLMDGTPNTEPAVGEINGRLTLTSVWFEYDGVVETMIAPYEFSYTYAKSTDYGQGEYVDKYPEIVSFADGLAAADENPDYNADNTDPWGNYAYNGSERKKKMLSGVEQQPASNFDPAAWQLKRIFLPSGGEIHVQYEQNDYNYVQDRRAMVLAPIHSAAPGPAGAPRRFYIDLSSVPGGEAARSEIRDLMYNQFVPTEKDKTKDEIYCKFLFRIKEYGISGIDNIPLLDLPEFRAEYVTGHTAVKNVEVENDNGTDRLVVTLALAPEDNCMDFFETNRLGFEDGYKTRKQLNSAITSPLTAVSILSKLLAIGEIAGTGNACRTFDASQSFIRIPVTKAKKGGGVRVKRILMYDTGVDGSEDRIFGSEYLYTTEEAGGRIISSGVATNEPASMREENPLVLSMKQRHPQSSLERWTAGEDKQQFEGPLGETLLPGPSVGYSRVIVKNIHGGVNGEGFKVHEFHTCKDFPFDVRTIVYDPNDPNANQSDVNETVEWTTDPVQSDNLVIPAMLYQETSAEVRGLQGYRFLINEMHGRAKRVTTYGGDFADRDSWFESAMQETEYYAPGEEVPMFYGLDKPLRYELPGVEMEVTLEARHVSDYTVNGAVQTDLTLGPATLGFPIPTLWPSLLQDKTDYKQLLSSKVIRYPVIPKRIKTLKDGVRLEINNLAFDPATGEPVITTTTDDFHGLVLEQAGPDPVPHNGTYTTYNLMAWSEYQGMNQIAGTEGMRLTFTHTSGGQSVGAVSAEISEIVGVGRSILFKAPGTSAVDVGYLDYLKNDVFEPGDYIEIVDEYGVPLTVHLGGLVYNPGTPDQMMYAVDRPGYVTLPLGTKIHSAKIIRSARDNSLTAPFGTIMTYGEDKSAALTWARELRRREAISEHLNNQLFECGHMSIAPGDLPSGNDWFIDGTKIDPSAASVYNWDDKYRLNFWLENNGGQTDESTICYNAVDVVCGSALQPNQWIVDLNDYMATEWNEPVVATINQTPEVFLLGLTTFFSYDRLQYQADAELLDKIVNPLASELKSSLSATYNCMDLNIETMFDLQTTEYRSWVNGGPNSGEGGTISLVRRSPLLAGSSDKRVADMHLVRSYSGEPLLRYSVQFDFNTDCPPPYIQCLPETYFKVYCIPGTDAQLHQAGMTRDDFLQGGLKWDDIYSGDFKTTIGEFGMTNDGKLTFTNHMTGQSFTYPDVKFSHTFDPADPEYNATIAKHTLHRSTAGPGYFAVDDVGDVVFYAHENSTPQKVEALELLEKQNYAALDFDYTVAGPTPDVNGKYLNQVVSANATTYYEYWYYDYEEYGTENMYQGQNNPYVRNARGRYRPWQTWVVRQDQMHVNRSQVHEPAARVWNTGVMREFTPFVVERDNNGFPLFNDNNTANGWVRTAIITEYSPHGEGLEQLNALNIPSAVRFGYSNMLPVAVAQNARYNTILFESFEEDNGSLDVIRVDAHAHAGDYSCRIAGNNTPRLAVDLNWSQSLDDNGALIQFWLRNDDYKSVEGIQMVQMIFDVNGNSQFLTLPGVTEIARTGEWSLYTVQIPTSLTYDGINSAVGYDFRIQLLNPLLSESKPVWIDDVRFQPYESEMATYVYDPDNLRVVAMFDDQHFGMYYQYDGQGRLVRTLKETVRGFKTVQEGHIHTPLVNVSTVGLIPAVDVPQELDPQLQEMPSRNLNKMLQQSGKRDVNQGGSFDFNRTLTLPDNLFESDSSSNGTNGGSNDASTNGGRHDD